VRLYHQPRSRSTHVLWLHEEIGQPFELVVIAREDKETDAYRALHPLGRAPVLEDDEGPLFESAALILHLADLAPERGLIGPVGSHVRALQYQWCFFGMTELEAPLMDVARQFWKETDDPIAEIVESGRTRFARAARAIESALGGDDYLVENTFSVADIVAGAALLFARAAELADVPDGLSAYLDRLEARPARIRAREVQGPVPAA
jgi:glutathione S-transferase